MNVLACDLGGTSMKIGIVRDGHVLAATTLPAHSGQGLAPRLPAIKSAWLQLLAQTQLTLAECAGVSVSFPSLLDSATGRVLDEYGKYPDAPKLDLRSWARAELDLPLAIENDARMALVGEWKHGAGRGCDNVVMITLGTGLGTATLIEGHLLRGRHGQAGVLGGHITLRPGGRPCNCGNIGCAEIESSAAFLRDIAFEFPEWNASSLQDEDALTYALVFRHAAAGDPCALRLRDHGLSIWSTLAVSLIHAYDPESLILGGGIMGSAGVILPAVSEYVRRHAHTPWGQVRVLCSELGASAALVAGEWLLLEQFPNLQK